MMAIPWWWWEGEEEEGHLRDSLGVKVHNRGDEVILHDDGAQVLPLSVGFSQQSTDGLKSHLDSRWWGAKRADLDKMLLLDALHSYNGSSGVSGQFMCHGWCISKCGGNARTKTPCIVCIIYNCIFSFKFEYQTQTVIFYIQRIFVTDIIYNTG